MLPRIALFIRTVSNSVAQVNLALVSFFLRFLNCIEAFSFFFRCVLKTGESHWGLALPNTRTGTSSFLLEKRDVITWRLLLVPSEFWPILVCNFKQSF